MKINRISLGGYIQKRRYECKLTQEELSAKIEKTVGYVGGIERGKDIPSLQVFVDIANALGISPTELLADSLETVENLTQDFNYTQLEILKYVEGVPKDQQENLLNIVKSFWLACNKDTTNK